MNANPPDWITKANGRLPWSDGSPRYVPVVSPSAVAADWSLVFLESKGWVVHRIGQAFHAHGPNGARWIGGWTIAGAEPRWWPRLLVRSAGDAPDGAGEAPDGNGSLPPRAPAVSRPEAPAVPGGRPSVPGPDARRETVAVR